MFTNDTILDMFVNQNSLKYQPRKRTIIDANGHPVTIYAVDPSIFEDQNTLSHIRFNEAHANYRRWYVENSPAGVTAQLEAYDHHRRICASVMLQDEEDFMMIKIWCKAWMQRATWNPTTWDEKIYHREFEESRARYFGNKVARQMVKMGEASEAAGDSDDPDESDDDRESTPPQQGGADRGRSVPDVRYSPYAHGR